MVALRKRERALAEERARARSALVGGCGKTESNRDL
jgi:hypothetical protein